MNFPIFLRLAGRPVILLGDGPAAEAKGRLLDRAGAVIVGEEAPATLAVVAIADDAEARAAVARLRARHILVNAVDRPDLCDFTLPAIVDRDPLLIAIGTGGASAGLAKAVRQRIEALLPGGAGAIATALAAARAAIRARWPDTIARREAIDAALAEGGPLDPFADTGSVEGWLASETADQPAETAHVLLRSPDADDLTLREARLLGRAERICHGPDVPISILSRARADATRIAGDPPVPAGPGLTLILRWAG
ncbi:NAD(P)-dependent oxidoreductase [Sphingomonas naphthae]|uniref:precorrin-2 dehydrogenase n=1 Tax=Sphingomonas naphthae TaxID=1813468 RepID=A0ABY7TNF3_9SPHN|nr:NAD(P)-dependent oxidoreductase [Sphingomonas naphthae]WCT73754.1 NAD(P)-dependent oxidoreductase [Sphingomonas naphthae]